MYNDITDSVLEHMKCVICQDYFVDMMQCYNGHSHCKTCLKKYEFHISRQSKRDVKCSVCMSKRGWCTNRQMSMLAENLKIKMMCGIDGCERMLKTTEIEEHRKKCECRLYTCPVNGIECKHVRYADLYRHVCSHNKVLFVSAGDSLHLGLSELVNYGPRIILFQNHVIQLNCQITYERRCDTRLIIKCFVLGPEVPSETQIDVWLWDMLHEEHYTHVCKELQMMPDVTDMSEDIISLASMNNYTSELPDQVIVVEKVEKMCNPMRPSSSFIGCKLHGFDVNEECQEVFVFTVQFTSLAQHFS